MKYALIGCGRISPNHIEAAKNNKLDFVAMCDIVPEIMQEKAEKFSLQAVKQYTDYKDLLQNEKLSLSFEVFPPKTDAKYDDVIVAVDEIAKLQPSFISVTYGAGGSTKGKTVEIASKIKNDYGIEAVA